MRAEHLLRRPSEVHLFLPRPLVQKNGSFDDELVCGAARGAMAENGADTRRDIKSGWVQQNRPEGIDGAHVQSIQPELSRHRENV